MESNKYNALYFHIKKTLIYILHQKDIVIHCHLARFLYIHVHVHVHVLTLTSHRFFRYGRCAGTESCRWQLGAEVHKLRKERFHQTD